MVMLCFTSWSRNRPSPFRSAGRNASPSLIASWGDIFAGRARPSSVIVPPVVFSAPNSARATSNLPEPVSPPMPRISPGRTSKLMSEKALRCDRPAHLQNRVSADLDGFLRVLLGQRLAHHQLDDAVDAGARGCPSRPTLRPSRRTMMPVADLQALFQVMRHIYDSHAGLAQFADDSNSCSARNLPARPSARP